jgi:Fe2+ transport system protein FeoA
MKECSLNRLAPGVRAVVRRVEGDVRVRQRLLEMGLTSGARVAMVRSAPLGDPVEVSVRGYHLSLRRREAQSITVSHEEAEHGRHDALASALRGTGRQPE